MPLPKRMTRDLNLERFSPAILELMETRRRRALGAPESGVFADLAVERMRPEILTSIFDRGQAARAASLFGVRAAMGGADETPDEARSFLARLLGRREPPPPPAESPTSVGPSAPPPLTRKTLQPLVRIGPTGPVTGFETVPLQDRPGYYSVGFSGEAPLVGNMYVPKDPYYVPPERQEELAAAERRRRLFEDALAFQRRQAEMEIQRRRRERQLGLSETAAPQDTAAQFAETLLQADQPLGGLSASDLIRLRLGQMTDDRVRAGIALRERLAEEAQELARERIRATAENQDIANAIRVLGIGPDFPIRNLVYTTSEGETLTGFEVLEHAIQQMRMLREMGAPFEDFEERRLRSEAEMTDEDIVDALLAGEF